MKEKKTNKIKSTNQGKKKRKKSYLQLPGKINVVYLLKCLSCHCPHLPFPSMTTACPTALCLPSTDVCLWVLHKTKALQDCKAVKA